MRAKQQTNTAPEGIAAVDLGSNSFHMIVGELRHGQLTIIDRLKETVRLSEGLKKNGDLSAASRRRALECLARFGERLHNIKAANVRAAGTSTLRRARDSKQFREEAELALGHPIEVISGIEEARLIYSGVTHSTPPSDGLRLVLDIGGGSTELILGEGPVPKSLESLKMGCVLITESHFVDGEISREAFDKARIAARLRLRPVKAFFRKSSDIESIGASGTIRASVAVARELGIIESGYLTQQMTESLIERVLEFRRIEDISLPGLSERRAQVWPGGLAILVEVLAALRVEKLGISDGALREGLLYEHLGRAQHEDARERSVVAIATRYHVDLEQADRVAKTAGMLYEQCKSGWQLRSPLAASLLEWAARLHEIGLDIAHNDFHLHGAYVADNADMPGFPHDEQRVLAFIIRNQRGAIKIDEVIDLQNSWRPTALRLAILMRLAVLLNRSRSVQGPPKVILQVAGETINLRFPESWLDDNPLSVADLQRERRLLVAAGLTLDYV